jgi:hypothetical protein
MTKLRNWSALNFYATVTGVFVAMIGIAIAVYLSSHSQAEPVTDRAPNENSSHPPPASSSLAREMSYFIELIDSSDKELKFHFRPRLRGYLYIVAPGRGNQLETVLTAQPPNGSDLLTNAVGADEEFIFPKNPDQWIGLRDDAFVTPFTIIFSTSPLSVLSFLDGPSGRTLTLAEQQQFERFREHYSLQNNDSFKPAQGDPNTVTVNVPDGQLSTKPLVFNIALKRK